MTSSSSSRDSYPFLVCSAPPPVPPPQYRVSPPPRAPPSYPGPRGPDTDTVTIVLSCPSSSSVTTYLSLYAMVMASLVSGLSALWIFGHIFVLVNTSEHGLKLQRYIHVVVFALLLSRPSYGHYGV